MSSIRRFSWKFSIMNVYGLLVRTVYYFRVVKVALSPVSLHWCRLAIKLCGASFS